MWSPRGVVPPNLVRLQKRATFPLFRSLLLGLENKQWAQVQAPALSEANVFVVIVSKVWSSRTVVSIQNKASLVWRREVKQTKQRTWCVWRVCVRVQRTLLIRGAPGSSANCTETCSHVESTPQAKKAFCVRFLANKTHNKEGAEKRASVSDKDQQTPSEVSFLFLWPLSTQKGLWSKTGLIFFGCQMIHLVEWSRC